MCNKRRQNTAIITLSLFFNYSYFYTVIHRVNIEMWRWRFIIAYSCFHSLLKMVHPNQISDHNEYNRSNNIEVELLSKELTHGCAMINRSLHIHAIRISYECVVAYCRAQCGGAFTALSGGDRCSDPTRCQAICQGFICNSTSV